MGSGRVKTINEAAMGMVLDSLQKYQYLHPVKSTTRELASNGLDSIEEKKMAVAILSGQANISDYFEESDNDPIYKDSSFDPNYYNLKWFSDDNKVYITYYVGSDTEKDYVVFEDNGVGLGGDRLPNYFQVGYSTKRLSKMPLGKWGIGAKSPLSVGVDFYTVESRYNGRLFRFNVYSKSFDSIIPRINMETGVTNGHIVWNENTVDEYHVYYEETTKPNGVTITIGAKKNHLTQYTEAVKSQLLYFQNIEYAMVNRGLKTIIPYRAEILYEDAHIVLSDNPYYTKPHLLLNKVNYGYIDWAELELNDRQGNIGIKVAPEDIEVTPSREGVMWSQKTKDMVSARFTTVQKIASDLIQEELKETDLIKWLRICTSIGDKYTSGNAVVSRLSKIVDMADINPQFLRHPDIRYFPMGVLSGLYMRHVIVKQKEVQNTIRRVVERNELKHAGAQIHLPIVLIKTGEPVSNRKDRYLNSLYDHGFLLIAEPMTEQVMEEQNLGERLKEYLVKLRMDCKTSPELLWDYVTTSTEVVFYTDIEVPDHFTGTDEEEDSSEDSEEDQKTLAAAAATAEERRKLENKILVHTPRSVQPKMIDVIEDEQSGTKGVYQNYVWEKIEQRISEINNWKEPEIYYGTDDDQEALTLVAFLTRQDLTSTLYKEFNRSENCNQWSARTNTLDNQWYNKYRCQNFYDTDVKLIRVSQANRRYVRDFRHVNEFFISIKNNKVGMSNTLIKWNTARIIKQCINQVGFLYNWSKFNEDMSVKYHRLVDYAESHYRNISKNHNDVERYGLSGSTVSDLINHLDRVRTFQEYVAKNPEDQKEIGILATQLFGNSSITDGQAVDAEMIAKLNEVLAYGSMVGVLPNYISVLTVGDEVPEELEQEIKFYLESKGLLNYEVPIPESSVIITEDTYINPNIPPAVFEQSF